MKFLLPVFMICFSVVLMAQTSAPVQGPVAQATVAPVAPMAASSPTVLEFIKENLAAVALAVYGLLDVLILVSPKIAANGLAHFLFVAAGKAAGLTLPPTPPTTAS